MSRPTRPDPRTLHRTTIQVAYPQNTHKRDELTTGGDPEKTFTTATDTLLANAVNGPLPRDANLRQPTFHYDANSCYRNAVLHTLFSLKPFVNFLNLAATQSAGQINSVTMLKDMAAVYWDNTLPQAQRILNLQPLLNQWWTYIQATPHADGVTSAWNGGGQQAGQQADADEFLFDNLSRMINGELVG